MLTFGNPYGDDMIIIPYIEMIIGICSLINSKTVGKKVARSAQEELTVLNKPNAIAAGCCVWVRLRHRAGAGNSRARGPVSCRF